MDVNIQTYATQLAEQVMETKQADGVSILVMRVKDGEMLAMVNIPEFNLNDPYTLTDTYLYREVETETEEYGETVKKKVKVAATREEMTDKEYQDRLNQMWRNGTINDTYEPGSTFKPFTVAMAIENGIIKGAEAMDDAGNTYYDLNPQGTATRAQFARVLHRYVGGATE